MNIQTFAYLLGGHCKISRPRLPEQKLKEEKYAEKAVMDW